MFKNYLKTAIRNLWKNKGFSAINIIGLSAGLAVCLLIILYVVDESSYDKHQAKADRIYRLDVDIAINGTLLNSAQAPDPLGPTLVRDYPQIEQMVRFTSYAEIYIKKDNQNIHETNAIYADSTFFKVFTAPMIAGDPATALNEPNSIVIDETIAKKYFNSTDVVGQTLYTNNKTTCKITGVIKDMPRQSHFHFHFIRPLRDSYRGNEYNWLSNNSNTYVLVKPGVSQAFLQQALNKTINKYLGEQLVQVVHTSIAQLEQEGGHIRYYTTPLTDIHLHSNLQYELEANGDITYVYIFSVIAALILLIACVNFMNLSTARSSNRAKEVGIRKVAGSLRSQLITQFLTESVLISFVSLLLALLLAAMLLPLFNQLAGKQLQVSTLLSTWLLPVMVLLIIIVGCIAGSYPAFYLSAFQPMQVLKGAKSKGFKSSWLRSSLVVFQFGISILLIIGTIVIYNQLNYIRNKKVGYNRDQVLVIQNTQELSKQVQPFKEAVLKMTGVEGVTLGEDLPTGKDFDSNGWFKEATMNTKDISMLTDFKVDDTYIPVLGMQIVAGRNFSREFPSDSNAFILNETAANMMGLKEPGKDVLYNPDYDARTGINIPKPFHLIGIVKDFNFSTLREKVGPMILHLGSYPAYMAVRVNTHNISSVISQIEQQWKKMAPEQSFAYSFMDADFNNIYNAEQQTGKLFMTFAVFAILIACLGLFGLVTYAAEQRTKEIGIRKVLGAGVSVIVTMITKDFVKLVLVASVIAFPVAWWAMNQWLQGFAFRTSVSWWIFVVAGATAIVIALVTVSIQAIKAAIANPVKSLKAE